MRTIHAALLSLVAIACGPAESGDEGESSGTGPSDDTSTSLGDDGGGSSSTGEPACDPSTPEIGDAVTVQIHNEGDVPLYLPETSGCVIGPVFSLTASGSDDPIVWLVDDCQTCAAAIDGACACPAACPIDSAIRLDPGGVYVTQWTGAIAFTAELAPECTDPFCGPQCTALAKAEDGTYVARAAASTTIDCGAPTCDCVGQPAPAGWCRVNGIIDGNADITAERELTYPSTIPVELVLAAP